jgi:hypothetical protein
MKLIIIAIALIFICSFIVPVSADNTTAEDNTTLVTITATPTPTPTTYVPTATPTPATTVLASTSYNDFVSTNTSEYEVSQGDNVYVGDTVDISRVTGWAGSLAWFNGYEPGDGYTPFTIPLPETRKGYYNFYVNPDVFKDKLGMWYQWYGNVEGSGNLEAFYVMPASMKQYAQPKPEVNITENISVANKNLPIVPTKHISDYLVARGDDFNISVNGYASVWLFGVNDGIYDYNGKVNNSVTINSTILRGCSPGSYQLLVQEHGNYSSHRLLRYNTDLQEVEWFDIEDFMVKSFSANGLSPQVLVAKIKEKIPEISDKFTWYKFEIQEPSISIVSIDTLNMYNQSIYDRETTYVRNETYLDVRGYTNVAPGTNLTYYLDKEKGIESYHSHGIAWGNYGGDMRWFQAIIPIDKFDMPLGEHWVRAETELGGYTIVPFVLYEYPEGTYIPDKPIRYVSGRYGDTEFIPTPTPQTVIVTQQVTVTRTITIPVTPSDEQVKAQQDIIISEKWDATLKLVAELIWVMILGGYLMSVIVRRIRNRNKK